MVSFRVFGCRERYKAADLPLAQEHFEEIGYREGRHAYPGFALMKRDELNDIDRANRCS